MLRTRLVDRDASWSCWRPCMLVVDLLPRPRWYPFLLLVVLLLALAACLRAAPPARRRAEPAAVLAVLPAACCAVLLANWPATCSTTGSAGRPGQGARPGPVAVRDLHVRRRRPGGVPGRRWPRFREPGGIGAAHRPGASGSSPTWACCRASWSSCAGWPDRRTRYRRPLTLAIFVPKCCDIGAYFTGRLLGRHRMTPVLSPKKTWEGFAGGLVASAVAGGDRCINRLGPGCRCCTAATGPSSASA